MKNKNPIQKATIPQYLHMMHLRIKLAWVEWMERQSGRLGRKGHYVALGLFVSISMGCCVLLITGGFSTLIREVNLQPAPIVKVKSINANPASPTIEDSVLEQGVQSFRNYMDSLARSPSGMRLRDSLLNARPGLMDSIKIAETLINNRKTTTYEKQ